MNADGSRRRAAEPAVRIVAWSVAIPVALASLAPDLMLVPGRYFEHLVALLVYLPLGIGATLWAAASLRPGLGVVVEDAFGRRSDLANAASGCTTTTFALFGLAFAMLNVPGRPGAGESLWPLVADRLGWLLLALGIAALAITIRSVRRRNEREVHRRVVARARAEVRKDLNESLATKLPHVPGAPTAW